MILVPSTYVFDDTGSLSDSDTAIHASFYLFLIRFFYCCDILLLLVGNYGEFVYSVAFIQCNSVTQPPHTDEIWRHC